jgi:HTH-type transcriptional regulator / antitoxin HigA
MVATKKAKYPFDPDYAVAPGETLAETLESLSMTQADLALRTGLTVVSINRIIKGQQPISAETANKLELVTGVPASLWNNLEAQYREQLSKIEQRKRFQKDLQWLKTMPVKELISRKVIPAEKDQATQLRLVLSFYRTSSVDAWHKYWESEAVAARRSQAIESHQGPTSAWIRLGEIQAQSIACKPFDKGRFTVALRRIRDMTVETPDVFIPKMRQQCADAGVALSLVPEFKGARWYGATKWLTPTKAMILLCLRGKREDQFWFSFFHEAGHVLNDRKKDLFINDGSKEDPREQKANEFASTFLVPPDRQQEIPTLHSRDAVQAYAAALGISPGIVVGQYERMTGRWGWFADLKRKFVWND